MTIMWERVLTVHRFARAAERVNHWLPGGERHRMPWGKLPADIYGLMTGTPAHVSFTSEEEGLGREALRRLGISEGQPFICFHARDAAYDMTQLRANNSPSLHLHRNSDIQTYLPAVEALVQRGYAALRMGAVVATPLRTTTPGIIDYATVARTDFLDVFLCGHCRFFLAGPSGLAIVSVVFRRPVVFVNSIPLEHFWRWTLDLFVPKKLWLRSERRFLTFPEIIRSGTGRLMRTEQYEQRGLEVVNNTPEDIMAVALEMDDRLNGTWQTTEEDEDLQRRFWSLFANADGAVRSHLFDRWPQGLARPLGPIRARIGTEFLRQHRALLEERTAPAPVIVTVSSE